MNWEIKGNSQRLTPPNVLRIRCVRSETEPRLILDKIDLKGLKANPNYD